MYYHQCIRAGAKNLSFLSAIKSERPKHMSWTDGVALIGSSLTLNEKLKHELEGSILTLNDIYRNYKINSIFFLSTDSVRSSSPPIEL